MKKSANSLGSALLALLLLLAPATVNAQSRLPNYYPPGMLPQGSITRVDAGQGEIVIQDRLYRLDENVKVRTPSSVSAGLSALRAGSTIAISTEGARDDHTITEIWLLPSGYILRAPDR